MELQSFKCTQCGASIPYTIGDVYLKCEFCGAEYALKSDESSAGVDYMGRGQLFHGFIPHGWNLRIISDDNSASYQATVCRALQFDSPDGARLLFYPFAYFRTFGSGKLNFHKNYQIDAATGTRYRCCIPPEQYATERIAELFGSVSNIHITEEPDTGEVIKRRATAFLDEASKALKRKTCEKHGKYAISFEANGVHYNGYFATAQAAVVDMEPQRQEPKSESREQKPQPERSTSGFLGKLMNYKGVLGGPSLSDITGGMSNIDGEQLLHTGKELLGTFATGDGGLAVLNGVTSGANWARAFDFIIVAPNTDSRQYLNIFNEFCACLQYGPLYYALQDEEAEKLRQIILNGMQQRQQIAFAGAQRVRQTMNETSDIINRGYQQRSATMDNIYRKQSEAARGVNTYTDNYGRDVQADVRFERVYQKGDSYAGTTDAGAEPGADWQELHRK